MKKQSFSEKKPWYFRTIAFITDESNAIALKSAVFFLDAAVISIFPFLVLHMQLLGITIKEIALIFLLVPIASLLGPIISGLIADKIGKFNVVVGGNIILAIVMFDLLIFVPPIDKEYVTILCSPEQTAFIGTNICYDCFLSGEPKNFTLKNCQEFGNSSSNFSDENLMQFALENQSSVVVTAMSSERTNSNCNALDLVTIFSGNLTVLIPEECDATLNITCQLQEIADCVVPYTSSHITTAVTFFIFTFLGFFFAAAGVTILDAALLAASRKHNLEVGKQKVMAMVAFGLTPLVVGILIDFYSQRIGRQSYLPAYVMSTIFGVIAFFIMIFNDISVSKNEGNMLAHLVTLFKRVDVVLFILICLVLGSHFGFIEGYLFIYLKSLGAPNYLLGLTLTVGFFSSIPVMYYADWIEKKIGRLSIFIICFAGYAVRLFGYSFMENPWISLAFEVLEAVTYQLMWLTCLKLCPILAPKGLLATMTGIAGASHYSIGKGIGGFLGGYLIQSFGIKGAYRIFGCIALTTGCVYFVLHKCYFKKVFEMREKELEEREAMEESVKENGSTRITITQSSPDSNSYSYDLEVNISKSMQLLASSMTNLAPPADLARKRSRTPADRDCVSVYDNLTDDGKTQIPVESRSLLYPSNELKIMSKSEGILPLIE